MRSPSVSATALADPVPAPRLTPLSTPLGTAIRVHPFRFDAELAVDVPLVRWPDAATVREQLREAGSPCLLIVGAVDRAPRRWSDLEDWVRQSAPESEFVTRAVTVARRADLLAPPTVERARSVHFRGRTATVPSTQGALVTTLVSRFGGTVSDPEIRALCEQGGISTHGEAVKTAMRRLKQILAPLGLCLTRVRSAGYLLDRRE